MEMENYSGISMEDEQIELPPGFRFHPTDEELITHYLARKVADNKFDAIAVGEADLNKIEPWDLPKKAKLDGKEWYFFVVRDRKYPTGLRTNRATEAGYWKATGKDKEIFREKTLVGMKKTLVFYTGRAPKGEKTNWVIHEYRLDGKYAKFNNPKNVKKEWVISRVFEKSSAEKKSDEESQATSLPPLMDTSPYNRETTVNLSHVTCFSRPLVVEDRYIIGAQMQEHNLAPATPLYSMKSSFSDLLTDQDMADFQFVDSIFEQDQSSILKLLTEGQESNVNWRSKTEVSCESVVGYMNTHVSFDGSNNERTHDPASLTDLDSFFNFNDD